MTRFLPLFLLAFFFLAVDSKAQPGGTQITYTTTDPTGLSCAQTQIYYRMPQGTFYTCQNGTIAILPGSGGGSGTVTSVQIVGTPNEIEVSGTCTITAAGVCTVGIVTNPTLGGTNFSGIPVSALASLGTGVATALGQNVSGTGSICLSSGSACSGGGGSSAFNDITTGTNTTATMTVGTGGSLLTSGSGTIAATSAPLAGISGLGTGVATALAANVSGTGAICLASGSACSGGGGTPAGMDTQVQFNDMGSFGASSAFTFNSMTELLSVTSILTGGGSGEAGAVGFKQGTACTPGTTEICLYAPASVTSYGIVLPAAVGSTGVIHNTTASTTSTWSYSQIVNADIANSTIDLTAKVTGTLPVTNGGTGITSFGTGVATAMGQNVSGSGSFCLTTSCAMTSPDLGMPSAINLTNALAFPPVTTNSGTSRTISNNSEVYFCTGTCTVTPLAPVAGRQFCVFNDDSVTTVITLAALGSSAMYQDPDLMGYGTAGTGTFVGTTAEVGSMVCFVGKDTTHYNIGSINGTFTAS